MKRVPSWLWAIWLAITVVGFAFLEKAGIVSDAVGDTLSERLRDWANIDHDDPTDRLKTGIVGAISGALAGVAIWLGPHLINGAVWNLDPLIVLVLFGLLAGGIGGAVIAPEKTQ